MTPPRPPVSAELREAFLADYRAEHWPMLQRLDALIAAVRAETQRETYAMAARIADFEGAHGVSNRIRALVSK